MRILLLAVATLAGCGAASAPTVDAGPMPVSAIDFVATDQFTIVDSGGDHLAFPDVTRLADGRILLVYRRGAQHVDPSGRLMKQFGSADALTWGAAAVLYDEPGIDDRDPSVTTLANGDVVVDYFQYHTPATNLTVHQTFFTRSTDNGATYSPLVELGQDAMNPAQPTLTAGVWVDALGNPIVVNASSSSVVELGGRLLAPIYGGHALNLANLAAVPRSRVSLFTSDDRGGSFTRNVVAADQATNRWLMEPALLSLGGQRLLLQIRTADGASPSSAGHLVQALSDDGGATWSAYQDLGFVGHAPELVALDNGVLISAFRELDDAFTAEWVSFMYSLDGGTTWSNRIRVIDCNAVECGYPGLLQLDGDRLLIVYYAPGGVSIDATIYHFTVTR